MDETRRRDVRDRAHTIAGTRAEMYGGWGCAPLMAFAGALSLLGLVACSGDSGPAGTGAGGTTGRGGAGGSSTGGSSTGHGGSGSGMAGSTGGSSATGKGGNNTGEGGAGAVGGIGGMTGTAGAGGHASAGQGGGGSGGGAAGSAGKGGTGGAHAGGAGGGGKAGSSGAGGSLFPGEADCQKVGGSCTSVGDCGSAVGYLSDVDCHGPPGAGSVCCIPLGGCGTAGQEFKCCTSTATFRPSCTNGQLVCLAGQTKC
jgi:hypothetical protein